MKSNAEQIEILKKLQHEHLSPIMRIASPLFVNMTERRIAIEKGDGLAGDQNYLTFFKQNIEQIKEIAEKALEFIQSSQTN